MNSQYDFAFSLTSGIKNVDHDPIIKKIKDRQILIDCSVATAADYYITEEIENDRDCRHRAN